VSFNFFLGLSCVCACFLIATSIYQEKNLLVIKKNIAQIERENVFQQQSITKPEDIAQYQNQLSGLERQLLSKYQLWAKYKNITNAGKDGFSQYFYHIANLANANLSLYEISVSERGNHLALKGYATKAEDIPTYINHLKSKKELEHVVFGDLSIEKIEGHQILRFVLDKKEDEDKDDSQSIEKKINISDIMKMSLASNKENYKKANENKQTLTDLASMGIGK
jgi:hypothetical protein